MALLRGLAMLVAVAALVSVAQLSTPCPGGMICAALAPVSAEEVALMPESCLAGVAHDGERLRRAGFNALAVPLRIDGPDADQSEAAQIAPSALAGRLAWLATLVRQSGLRLLVRVESGGGCDAREIGWFLEEYRRARAARAGDLAAAPLDVYCASDRNAARITLADRTAGVLRPLDDPEGASFGLADATWQPAAATDVAAIRLDGFIAPGSTEVDRVRNGTFARGWDAWETSGRVALEPGLAEATTSCGPLMAVLAPAGRIAQGLALRNRTASAAAAAILRIDVQPADAERHLRVTIGPQQRTVAIPPQATRLDLDVPDDVPLATTARADVPLAVEVPEDETAPIALTALRVLQRWHAGSIAAFLASAGTSLGTPGAESNRAAFALAAHLADARIEHSDESFVRVERFTPAGTNAPGRSILAHPGTTRPTTLTWDLGAATCRRHLETAVGIAPDCRGVGDGVEFEARAGDRVARVRVASNDPVQRLQLDLDPPAAADGFPPVTLVLTTSAGGAHDTQCDWALWMDPRVSCAPSRADADRSRAITTAPSEPRRLDLAGLGSGAPLATRWDELNVWKLYTAFGPQRAWSRATDEPGWLRARVPWATHARVLAAFGGNSCRHIADDCRRGIYTSDHPFRGRCWEGADGRAAAYEILRDQSGDTLDFATWKAALDDLLASGLLPHLNVSAAPCAVAGGHEYRTYHWNQKPVAHHEAWRAFLGAVGAEIAREPSWREWRFSITNEPNCLWIGGRRGDPFQHLGFIATSDEYADHFVETAAALRAALPGARIHLGNFTIGGKFALEDNLPEYLGALAAKLAASGMPASDFSALSFSLYETPQHALPEMPAYKFGRLRHWIGPGSPFAVLPWKLDEVEIHPLVVEAFREATGKDLDATRWAAGWHADVLALAVQEHVRSVAPWLGRLFADETLSRPHPKYWTYALASLAAGAVEPASGDWLHPGALVPRGTPPPTLVAVHRAAADVDGIGYLVTHEPAGDVYWILAWRHDPTPVTDDVADAGEPTRLAVRLPASTVPRTLQSIAIGTPPTADVWRLAPWGATTLVPNATALTADTFTIQLRPETLQLIRIGN